MFHYRPVVDQFPVIPALDPPTLLFFGVVFAACALVTMRRPAYGLSALVFTLPFALYHAIFATQMSLPKVVLAGVAAGLLGIPRAWSILRSTAVLRVLGAVLIYTIVTALTALVAQYHMPVLTETLKWLQYGLLFAVVCVAYAADPDERVVRVALFASIALVCLSALVQEVIGAPWGIVFGHGVVPRISGAIEGPNQLAAYLEIAIAALAAWHVALRSRAGAVLLCIATVTLLLTFSRAGVIAGAVAAITVIAVFGARAWKAIAPFVIGGFAGAALDGSWIAAAHALPVLHTTVNPSNYAGGVGNRSELWRAAWYFFRQHPLLGIGAGNYELELSQAGIYGVRTHANSWFLQSLAEGGILLFAATVTVIATVLASLYHQARRSPWAVAAFAATVALAAHQIIDYVVFYPKVGEPWIALVALGIADLQREEPRCAS
jgi:O-antigen ligase